MKCIGILWNSMISFKEEAILDIEAYGSIIDIIDIDLKDNIINFIWNVYGDYSEIVRSHVICKINSIINYYDNNNITVLLLDIPNEKVKELKTFIRKKYSQRVVHYEYDNVFHLTENEIEYDKVIDALNNINIVNEGKKKQLKKYDAIS